MRVLYFAQARLASGCAEENLNLRQPLRTEMFWDLVIKSHPSLLPLHSSCRLARNGRFLQLGEILEPDDEVAILPPVSGG